MKFILSTLAAVVLMASAAPALAADFDVRATAGYVAAENATDAFLVEARVSHPVGPVIGDVTVRNERIDGTSIDVRRAEVGATVKGNLFYVRGATGYRWNTSGADWAYWSVEPGVTYAFNENLSAAVGVRYRNSFDQSRSYETVAVTPRVTYDVGAFKVFGGVDAVQGDQDYNEYKVGVSKTF